MFLMNLMLLDIILREVFLRLGLQSLKRDSLILLLILPLGFIVLILNFHIVFVVFRRIREEFLVMLIGFLLIGIMGVIMMLRVLVELILSRISSAILLME